MHIFLSLPIYSSMAWFHIEEEAFCNYLVSLCKSVPLWVSFMLLSTFVIGAFVLFLFKGGRIGFISSAKLFLLNYTLLLLSSTVFFRGEYSEAGHCFKPFWSYEAIRSGKTNMIPETIMNVVVFIPIGFVLGIIASHWKKEGRIRRSWLLAALAGTGLSVWIETIQFVFRKGCSEIDDVIHNTIGCMLGLLFCLSTLKVISAIQRRNR